MPKSNKFSLGGPDSIQFRCGTQNRYFGRIQYLFRTPYRIHQLSTTPSRDRHYPRDAIAISALVRIHPQNHHNAVSQLPRSVHIPSTIPGSAQIQYHRPESVIPGTPILRIGTCQSSFSGSPHSESYRRRARTGRIPESRHSSAASTRIGTSARQQSQIHAYL